MPKVAFFSRIWQRLKRWETLLVFILIIIFLINNNMASGYLTVNNQANLFILSIEKVIVALTMTFLIINGEIDLSVSSIMGLVSCATAYLYSQGMPFHYALLISFGIGIFCGVFNGFWVAYAGLNSLIVTLAMGICYRGLARVFLEDRSIGNFPAWFNHLGQKPILGPLPLSMIIFFSLLVIATIILHFSSFGRRLYFIGNNKNASILSGVKVKPMKMGLFIASAVVSSITGLLYAARLGAVRGDIATGFELDIITMSLLGGVSIFGGSGTLYGVLIAILIVLNLRNGMGLAYITAQIQTGVIGALLILSVLVPNSAGWFRQFRRKKSTITSPQDT